MIEAGDTDAMINMGVYYAHGMYELPLNHAKALEYIIRQQNLVMPQHMVVLQIVIMMVVV